MYCILQFWTVYGSFWTIFSMRWHTKNVEILTLKIVLHTVYKLAILIICKTEVCEAVFLKFHEGQFSTLTIQEQYDRTRGRESLVSYMLLGK